jgi:hypothetical protein
MAIDTRVSNAVMPSIATNGYTQASSLFDKAMNGFQGIIDKNAQTDAAKLEAQIRGNTSDANLQLKNAKTPEELARIQQQIRDSGTPVNQDAVRTTGDAQSNTIKDNSRYQTRQEQYDAGLVLDANQREEDKRRWNAKQAITQDNHDMRRTTYNQAQDARTKKIQDKDTARIVQEGVKQIKPGIVGQTLQSMGGNFTDENGNFDSGTFNKYTNEVSQYVDSNGAFDELGLLNSLEKDIPGAFKAGLLVSTVDDATKADFIQQVQAGTMSMEEANKKMRANYKLNPDVTSASGKVKSALKQVQASDMGFNSQGAQDAVTGSLTNADTVYGKGVQAQVDAVQKTGLEAKVIAASRQQTIAKNKQISQRERDAEVTKYKNPEAIGEYLRSKSSDFKDDAARADYTAGIRGLAPILGEINNNPDIDVNLTSNDLDSIIAAYDTEATWSDQDASDLTDTVLAILKRQDVDGDYIKNLSTAFEGQLNQPWYKGLGDVDAKDTGTYQAALIKALKEANEKLPQ